MTKIFHAHLYGSRETKYDCLLRSEISQTVWSEILPQTPFHLLIPQNTKFLAEYEQGRKITDIMSVTSTGVKTHRDHFVVDFDAEKLKNRIAEFRNLQVSDDSISTQYSLPNTRDWKINSRRCSLAANENWESYLTKCLYRPFDVRAYYHHQDVVELPRHEVMQHFLEKENLALICKRQSLDPEIKNYFSCSDEIVADGYFAADNKGRDNTFPLYIYPDRDNLTKERRPNLSQPFLTDITDRLGYTPTPEAIFHYIYAIFHSPTYRSRYAEFLKIDFPRVPLTRNDTLFRQLAAYGEELVALHLMKSPNLEACAPPSGGRPITQFVKAGGNCIVDPAHPKYDRSTQTIVLNKKGDKFTGVPEAVWDFYVGGYPVCAKWLKDRKGRTLTAEDLTHYQRIVVALQETIRLMAAIDAAIPGFPIE